jgi:hypothetical protein
MNITKKKGKTEKKGKSGQTKGKWKVGRGKNAKMGKINAKVVREE